MNSLSQYCNLLGIPIQFLEKIPANMGIRVFSVLLDTCEKADGRQFLVRLNEKDGTRLRAILAHSFVRFDDRQVLRVLNQVSGGGFIVKNIEVDEDQMHLRLLLPARNRRPAGAGHGGEERSRRFSGIDLLTSETGAGPHGGALPPVPRDLLQRPDGSLPRTEGAEAPVHRDRPQRLRTDRAAGDQPCVHARARDGGAPGRDPGGGDRRSGQEVNSVFGAFRLGSPNGRIGRWVRQEVGQSAGLFGVQRFDFIQAFTAVARGLESRDRLRVEDAMGEYLVRGMGRN